MMDIEKLAREAARPDCFEFAMDFLGGPEDEIVRAYVERLERAIEFIGNSDQGGEIFPSGPADREYAEDGNTLVRSVPPWAFLDGKGSTFLEAVEDAMKNAKA